MLRGQEASPWSAAARRRFGPRRPGAASPAGVEKVLNGMEARLAKLAADEAAARPRPAVTTAQRSRNV
jgi:hypothetical protein